MDLIKIGRFIQDKRKEKHLTQLQLAQQLNITDRAVSKWETGRTLPDSSIMLELCSILEITVDELLSGEKTNMKNNNKNNEQLLLDMTKELEKKNKTIWTSMWIIMVVNMVALLAAIFIAGFFVPEGIWQLITSLGACIAFLPACFYALKLEVSVGAYKCGNCGNEFVPTYTQALNAMHAGFTRYLKCPECNKRTWCKKVIHKEEK